jgi:hypothetical protein
MEAKCINAIQQHTKLPHKAIHDTSTPANRPSSSTVILSTAGTVQQFETFNLKTALPAAPTV